jgi:hypothetical protein
MAGQQKNVFWVGANVLFDLQTGKTTQVLLLVYRVEDASTFNKQDADTYLSFVQTRANNIAWSIQRSPNMGEGRFVIRGEQNVEL